MPPRSPLSTRLSWCAAALWALLVVDWLAAVRGHGVPEVLSRAVLVGAIAATLAALAIVARQAIARDRSAALLLGLVALALVVRFAGIDHEVAERYYLDEGTYARHATDINRGELLIPTFVYPHLLYYLDAFVIWAASLFGGLAVGMSKALFGISDWAVVCRLLMRSVSALLGALTVLPVFRIAQVAAPAEAKRTAGLLGGLLVIFSTLYNDGSHLAICDVPSAFFATLTLAFCAGLLEREGWRGYLLAGAASGLAAGAKYPAGVVAVAIVAVWLRACLRERRFKAGIFWAGGASILAFLLSSPSLLVLPKLAWSGDRGIFFGVFQYAGEGWLGVVPESRTAYYLEELAGSFAWPALILGTLGLVPALWRDPERKAPWLLPYPAAYLVLLANLTVAVKRNLYPVVPALAAFLGVGTAALAVALASRIRSGPAGQAELKLGRWVAPALAVLVLVLPVAATVSQAAGLSRPGTRVVAREWIRAHVPRGAAILKDDYTPDFDPGEYFAWRPKGLRFVGQAEDDLLANPDWDLILVSATSYQRFFDPESANDPEARTVRARYQRIFDSGEPLARFEPGRFRLGPPLALYRASLAPSAPPPSAAQLRAPDAFLPDGSMRKKGSPILRFTQDGQWVMFKVRLAPGRYRCRLEGRGGAAPGAGSLRLVDLANQERGQAQVGDGGTALLDVPAGEKLFLYLHLPKESVIEALSLARDPA